MHTKKLAPIIAVLIAIVWTIAIFVALYTSEYASLNYITPIMLTAVGYLFGDTVLKRTLNGSNGANHDNDK